MPRSSSTTRILLTFAWVSRRPRLRYDRVRMRWLLTALLGASACGRFGFDRGSPLGDGGTDGTGSGDAAAVRHNRAFVTGATHTIPWGGVSGADGACQAAADTQQLRGTFIAFMGDDTTRPLPRLAGARGWVDLAGSAIADQPGE